MDEQKITLTLLDDLFERYIKGAREKLATEAMIGWEALCGGSVPEIQKRHRVSRDKVIKLAEGVARAQAWYDWDRHYELLCTPGVGPLTAIRTLFRENLLKASPRVGADR